jgi:hypothetical protein
MLYTIYHLIVTNQGGEAVGDDQNNQISQSVDSLMGTNSNADQPIPNLSLGNNPSTAPPTNTDAGNQTAGTPAQTYDASEGQPVDTTQAIDHSQDSNAAAPSDNSSTQSQAQPKDEKKKDKSDKQTDNELDDIRKEALEQLSPLINRLDQSPEERYKTLMTMIQASDNQSLIKEAFASANQINDDMKRAEALLGIINEINYFTKTKDSNN